MKTVAVATNESSSSGSVSAVALVTGALPCVLGLTVLLGWICHSATLVQLHPEFVPMQFNTALGFLLAGAGFLSVLLGRPRVAVACGSAVAAIGLLTLTEYIAGIDFGIDELFFDHDITVKTSHPGRMAPNTALCFAASGVAIAVVGKIGTSIARLMVSGLLASLILALSVLSLFGYLLGMEVAYGWGELTRMAVHTAAGFFVLGTSIFINIRREVKNEEVNAPPSGSHTKRLYMLSLTMSFVVVASLSVALFLLYNLAFERAAKHLGEMARGQANLILSEIDFDAEHRHAGESTGVDLISLLDELRYEHGGFPEFGESGVTCLARLEGDQMVFKFGDIHQRTQHPHLVPLPSGTFEPMQRALRGESGNLIGPDSRGITVLAAYEPVGSLGLGVVTKIDLAEIRAPFIKAGVTAALVGIVLIFAGLSLFRRISNPLLRSIIEGEKKYRALFESSNEAILLLGESFEDCNDEACRQWACDREDIIGHTPVEFSPTTQYDGRDSATAAQERINAALSGQPQLFQWEHRRKDGALIDTEVALKPIVREGKTLLLVSIRDVTERTRNLALIQLQSAALEAAANAIVIADHNGNIVWANHSFTDLTGYREEEVIGKNLRLLNSGRQEQAFYRKLWKTILAGETWSGELINRRKDGSEYFEDQTITPLCREGTRNTHYICIKQDVTARKRSERQIRDITYYDSLTGLPNRRLFLERLGAVVDSAGRERRSAALISLGLDRFEGLNHVYGHEAGDELLREAAERLIKSLRLSDYITRTEEEVDEAPVARFEGDEFTVMLTNIADARDAALVAGRLLDAVTGCYESEGREVFTTASVGVAVFPLDGEDPDTLLRNAETARQEAKKLGGNCWQFYAKTMNVSAARELDLESQMHQALERQEFSLHYQPQRDTVSGRLVGAEALLRWSHPESGPVSPVEFVPVLEQTGLIIPVGEWVLRTACEQAKAWQDQGFRPIRMAVNVSSYQFVRRSMFETVKGVLAETGLSAAELELELTESTLMQEDERTTSDLRRLHEAGVGLALDDFGTGYASLSYLRQYPFDRVKIDRSFVAEIETNADGARLAGAIIAMAHSLDLLVIAEGVETLEQVEFLRRNGCDELQGFLLSKPVPCEEFARFLEMEKENDGGPPLPDGAGTRHSSSD